MNRLPEDSLQNIFTFLDPNHLASCSVVNRAWNYVFMDSYTWKILSLGHTVGFLPGRKPGESYYDSFKRRCTLTTKWNRGILGTCTVQTLRGGHRSFVRGLAILDSEGECCVSMGVDNIVSWKDGAQLKTLSISGGGVAMSSLPHLSRVAVATSTSVSLWDGVSGKSEPMDGRLGAKRLSPHGQYGLLAIQGDKLRLFDVRAPPGTAGPTTNSTTTLGAVNVFALKPLDDHYIGVASEDGLVRFDIRAFTDAVDELLPTRGFDAGDVNGIGAYAGVGSGGINFYRWGHAISGAAPTNTIDVLGASKSTVIRVGAERAADIVVAGFEDGKMGVLRNQRLSSTITTHKGRINDVWMDEF
eukprot:PhF_6_TR20988/c0_g1_i2/m.30109